MEFSYTAPACPPTCSDPDADEKCADDVMIREGCVCKEGFILSGDRCVPEEQCGCQIRNRYFEVRGNHSVFDLDSFSRDVCNCISICNSTI